MLVAKLMDLRPLWMWAGRRRRVVAVESSNRRNEKLLSCCRRRNEMQTSSSSSSREIKSPVIMPRAPIINSNLLVILLCFIYFACVTVYVNCMTTEDGGGIINLNEMQTAKMFSYNEDENRDEKVAQLAQMAELMNQSGRNFTQTSMANLSPLNDGDSLGFEESVALGSSSSSMSLNTNKPALVSANTSKMDEREQDELLSSRVSLPGQTNKSPINLTSGIDQTQAAISTAQVPKFEESRQQLTTKSDVIISGSVAENRNDLDHLHHHQSASLDDPKENLADNVTRDDLITMQRRQPLKPEALHASDPSLKSYHHHHQRLSNFELNESDRTPPKQQMAPLDEADRKPVATSGGNQGRVLVPATVSQFQSEVGIIGSNSSNSNNNNNNWQPSGASYGLQVAAGANSNQEPFAPEILHDHNHESDKLRHQTQAVPPVQPSNQPAQLATSEHQQPQLKDNKQPQAQDQQVGSNLPTQPELLLAPTESPKLDLSGWIPNSLQASGQQQDHQVKNNPQVAPKEVSQRKQQQQQQQQQQQKQQANQPETIQMSNDERKQNGIMSKPQEPKNDVINFINHNQQHQLLMQSPQIETIKPPVQESSIQHPDSLHAEFSQEFPDSSSHESDSSLADTTGANYFMASNEMSFQSSPQPKHVSPPFIESLEQQDGWLRPSAAAAAAAMQAVGQHAATIMQPPHLATPTQTLGSSQAPSSGRFSMGSKLVSQTGAASENGALKGPLIMSSLKATGFGGLLPRLAAKIFNKQQQQDNNNGGGKHPEMDILNQQQSFQLPVHNAAPTTLQQQWTMVSHNQSPQKETSIKGGSKSSPSSHGLKSLGFPKGASLMKSLFSRDPQLFRGALLLPTRRPKIIHEASAAAAAATTSGTATTAAGRPPPPPLPQSKLVLMNGQVYSVLSGPPSQSQFGGGSDGGNRFNDQQQHSMKAAAAIFDHQTSDTSEFPVFEAMSMHHMNAGPNLATLDSMPQVQQSSRNSAAPVGPVRCDRPRHVIQADRSVVNHILQSQQNFVIARVPIRKYVRPPDTTTASLSPASSSMSQPGSHLYHAYPIQMLTSMSAPAVAYGGPGGVGPFGATNMAGSYTPNSQLPAFYHAEPSIEVATISRPTIWQSLANLVSSLRPRRQPLMQEQQQPQLTMIQTGASGATNPTSGSSPSAVYVSGPLIVATAAKRRRGRRFDGSNPQPTTNDQGDVGKAKTKRRRIPGSNRLLFGGGGRLFADRILYAASARSGSDTARLSQQMDPMQRLLMLKTATENEVCSPVSELGNKIKYSCLPNYCVAAALANATIMGAGGQVVHYQSEPTNGFEVYRQQQQQVSDANNILQRPVSGPDADEKLQVHQFDDLPSPLVTYTHINAYEPPTFSKMAQPQHQQFVTTSQALDALANNESEEAEMMAAEPRLPHHQHHQQIVYRPWVNNLADSVGQQHQVGQGLLYVQYPTTVPPSSSSPSFNQQQQPLPVRNQPSPGSSRGAQKVPAQNTVAFGTAYVTPTPQPVREKQRNSKRANRAPKAATTKSNADDNFDSDGPNEFASAVDDQLERPIRVNKTTRKQQQNVRFTNKYKKQQPEVENGGAGAENLLINSKQPAIRRVKQKTPQLQNLGGAQSGGRKQRRRAGNSGGWLPSTPAIGSGGGALPVENEDEPEYEEATSDYESSGEPEPVGFPGSLRPSTKYRQQTSSPAPNSQSQQPINMTHPIPVLNGMPGYTAQAANPRERKMRRRDNYQRGQQMGPTTGADPSSNRFGFRQSRPLPPPEKSDYETQPQIIDDDGLMNGPESHFDQNGYMINTTDCNCNTNNGRTGSADQNQAGPTTWPDSSDSGSVKRNPTTTTLRPRGSGANGNSQADLMLAKDRRQTHQQQQQQLHGSSGGLVQYTTKRPYNLRNTTYKNLLLQGNQMVANQLAPPDAAALLAPLGSAGGEFSMARPDISTTTPATDDLRSPSSTQWPTSGSGSGSTTSSMAPEQLIRHHVTYNNPEVRSHGHSSSLAPPLTTSTTSTTTPATTSNDYTDLENLAGERFHELSGDDDDSGDKLASGRTRPLQDTADMQAGWRARLLANSSNNQTTERPPQSSTTSSFKPSSVNDILAQARREQRASTRGSQGGDDGSIVSTRALDLERRQSAAAAAAAATGSSASSHRGSPGSSLRKFREFSKQQQQRAEVNRTSGGNMNSSSSSSSDDGDISGDGNENENDVTPHQYQIQLRWSNTSASSTVGGHPVADSMQRQARQLAAIDRMRERVRDNLYEHREEEHWHEKDWLKAGRRKSPTSGADGDSPGRGAKLLSLAEPSSIDYGPHASERETPVRDQLSNFASPEETERHFAIPTPNFLQSNRFVNWVQKAVNMDEEPGEPQVKPESEQPSRASAEQDDGGEGGSSTQASQQIALTASSGSGSSKRKPIVPANQQKLSIISSSIATAKQPSPPSISSPSNQLNQLKGPKEEEELKLGPQD